MQKQPAITRYELQTELRRCRDCGIRITGRYYIPIAQADQPR
jgi:hypothetical protein